MTKEINLSTKTKIVNEKHENLRAPLNALRSLGTIQLLKVSKNKHNITSNRIFKVNCEGIENEFKTQQFDKELEECL